MSKTDRTRPDDGLTPAEEEALQRFAAFRSGAGDKATGVELEEWLGANATHAASFASVESLWTSLKGVENDPRILVMRENARRRRIPRRVILTGLCAAAIGTILLFPLMPFTHTLPPVTTSGKAPAVSAVYQTGIGEISRFVLPDGSKVTLDADSVLTSAFDKKRRRLVLGRGRAYFQVVKDGRPFTVTGPEFVVTATGTAFVVDATRPAQKVSLVTGTIIASAPGSDNHQPLSANHVLTVQPDGQWHVSDLDRDQSLSWLERKLTFRNERLSVIADELNRYSTRKLVLADAELANIRLSAVLSAGDTDTFVSAVTDLGLARLGRNGSQTIVLRAK